MDFSITNGLVLIASYLLGAIPFGLVITRIFGLGDIREIGSGNIGATNVLRTGRKDLALATLLLDAGKGALAVLVTAHVLDMPSLVVVAGMATFIGHCFPIFLKFNGGKGVATFFGTVFAISWMVGLTVGAIWLLTITIFRMSSLAGLAAAVTAPVAGFYLRSDDSWIFLTAMTIVIFIRHRENIERILAGTESKIGKKK